MQEINNNEQNNTTNNGYEMYKINDLKISVFHYNSKITKTKFYHKHLNYEFIILLTTLKEIIFEGNKYVWEADTVYPISPNKMHGIENNIESENVSYIDIEIDNNYFNKLLIEMGYPENSELNYYFPFNRILATYILRFIKLYNSDKSQFKDDVLNSIKELICKELIYLSLEHKTNNIKRESEIKDKFSSIANYIATNYNNPNIVEHVATLHSYTPASLSKLFAKYYKIPIHQFILKIRLSNAKMLLKYTDLPINDIAKECGFSGTKYFSEVFTKKNNISPRIYRKNYKGTSEIEKTTSSKSIKNIINDNIIIYNEICYDKPEILYNDEKYSYFLIPLSLIKINEVVIMPKNLFYFEANEKLNIENIKNSTFYVLAIKKEIMNNIIDKYYIDLSNISVMSNSFFAYVQDIVNFYKENKSITNTLTDLIIKEIIYSYLGVADLFYEEVKQIINENINNDDVVTLICEKKGYSEKEFNKKFLKKFKVTPHKFLIHCRLLKAKEYLVKTNLKIDEIATKSGFVSMNSFIFHMKKQNHITPAQYRKKFQKTGDTY